MVAATAINATQNEARLGIELIILAGLNRALDGALEIKSWKHQILNQRRQFLLTIIGRILPIAVAIIVTSFFYRTISAFFYVLVASQITTQLIIHRLDNRKTKPSTPKRNISFKSIRTVTIVGFAAGIESLLIAGPRFLLQSTANESEVALYTIATQIAIGFGIFASIHLQFALPKFVESRTKDEQIKFTKKTFHETAVIWSILFSTGAALMLIPNQFWQLIFGDWLTPSPSLKIALPILISTWYASGFLANLINAKINKNWLAITAITTALVCLSQLTIANLAFTTISSTTILWALASGFLSRLALSALTIRKHLHDT
jgi:O-antigen/teichoic acid export membrane protein